MVGILTDVGLGIVEWLGSRDAEAAAAWAFVVTLIIGTWFAVGAAWYRTLRR